jgi:hypothetical protein
MIEKQNKEAEWMEMYTLTKEQQRKLIQDKLNRAIAYIEALKKREALIESR